jgi:hypothetical protein
MSLPRAVTGLTTQEKESLIGFLLNKLSPDGTLTITFEDLEDAPNVELRRLFETEKIEMRVHHGSADA